MNNRYKNLKLKNELNLTFDTPSLHSVSKIKSSLAGSSTKKSSILPSIFRDQPGQLSDLKSSKKAKRNFSFNTNMNP